MAPVTIAIYVLGAVLVLLVSFFVASPLFRPQEPLGVDAEPGTRERWERQKRQALAAIKEIELDHEMGKVSDEDLATMRGRFEAQALEAMAALEREGSR
jgi:hypothetical protein